MLFLKLGAKLINRSFRDNYRFHEMTVECRVLDNTKFLKDAFLVRKYKNMYYCMEEKEILRWSERLLCLRKVKLSVIHPCHLKICLYRVPKKLIKKYAYEFHARTLHSKDRVSSLRWVVEWVLCQKCCCDCALSYLKIQEIAKWFLYPKDGWNFCYHVPQIMIT